LAWHPEEQAIISRQGAFAAQVFISAAQCRVTQTGSMLPPPPRAAKDTATIHERIPREPT
jgi:hypothetical protein